MAWILRQAGILPIPASKPTRGKTMKMGLLGIAAGLLTLYALQPAGVALVVLGALYVAIRVE